MNEILKEVTEWQSDYRVPNHTYLLDGKGNIIAYLPETGGNIIISKSKSIKLNKRYRKFVKVKNINLAKLSKSLPAPVKEEFKKPKSVRAFKVKSNDREYLVEVFAGNKLSCNCVGFGYRGKCKHSDAVKAKLC
jgi:hypothetical protein